MTTLPCACPWYLSVGVVCFAFSLGVVSGVLLVAFLQGADRRNA